MTEMIELNEATRHPVVRVPGWEVAVSRPVWERCVAVPEGVVGRSEDLRLWDLLVFLWSDFRSFLARGCDPFAGFFFLTRVENDSRDWLEEEGEGDVPVSLVRLLAVAGVTRAGRPCLFVMPAEPHSEV